MALYTVSDPAEKLDLNNPRVGLRAVMLNKSTYPALEHKRYHWGDSWSGAKDQLQAIGIGVDALFPGEPGGPVRALTVRDARGMKVTIKKKWGASYGIYEATWRFWDPTKSRAARRRERTTVFAPGVNCYRGEYWHDVFTGTADALVAAGLIGHGQLPGQPGRGKVRCTYLADGTPARLYLSNTETAGYRVVLLFGKSQYRVTVRIPDEEAGIRRREREAYEEVEARARADARMKIEQEELLARRRRGHLRLVWSAQQEQTA